MFAARAMLASQRMIEGILHGDTPTTARDAPGMRQHNAPHAARSGTRFVRQQVSRQHAQVRLPQRLPVTDNNGLRTTLQVRVVE